MDSTRRRIAAGLLLAALAALGTGCAATGTPLAQGTPATGTPATGTPAQVTPATSTPAHVTPTPTASSAATGPVVSGQPVVLDENANSTTVHVRVGTTVELLLHSSYWNIAGSSSPAVLAPQGAPTQLPVSPACAPGIGCNPVRAMFSALSPGTSVLSASRTSCGEALRCGTKNSHFQVTVVVTQ